VEEKDDDGEGGAGDNLLHLLVKLNLVDVIVMVSRWYGGVKLGSDRYGFHEFRK
jgi:putative IMPACT (imprinted ancient) family translation regulator